MKEGEFYSRDSLSYFVHWLTLVTAELVQDVKNNENAADRRNRFVANHESKLFHVERRLHKGCSSTSTALNSHSNKTRASVFLIARRDLRSYLGK